MARFRSPIALLSLALLAAHSVLAQYGAYDYGFDAAKLIKRQLASQEPVPVVRGAEGGQTIRLRQEVRQLEQDKELWTLYILGLSLMQFTDQSSPVSWYGITGTYVTLEVPPSVHTVLLFCLHLTRYTCAFCHMLTRQRQPHRDTRHTSPNLGRCDSNSRK